METWRLTGSNPVLSVALTLVGNRIEGQYDGIKHEDMI